MGEIVQEVVALSTGVGPSERFGYGESQHPLKDTLPLRFLSVVLPATSRTFSHENMDASNLRAFLTKIGGFGVDLGGWGAAVAAGVVVGGLTLNPVLGAAAGITTKLAINAGVHTTGEVRANAQQR